MSTSPKIVLDVWLKFDEPDDEEASHEANVYVTEDYDRYSRVDALEFVVEWYHTAVGQVTRGVFGTYGEARAWLEAAGYQDFTTERITDYQAWLDAHDWDPSEHTAGPLTLADGYLNERDPGAQHARTCGCCGVEFAWAD